ncbi:GxxExxY protein [Chloroflexus sp. Y-396-1]|jgi:GxxExxY protein|uniref:GxxExxY protein n=1 Tax=Chloroflexus sp. Y-396-1 TaxID=867845 RepID=UPI0004911166|nr:GxxExxY protein [Chloroflexus sp. Y-396-1]
MKDLQSYTPLTEKIIGAAMEVHRALGPGLLESAYEACLVYELAQRGLKVEQQKPIPLVYKSVRLDCGYRLDLLVENTIIIEIKAVEELHPIHEAQLISYLKLSGFRVGLLINFNVRLLKDGIRRFIV